jgi:bacteriorhodopsin
MADGPEWFAPKRYGYGAGLPISWQGWLLTIGFVLLTIGVSVRLSHRPLELIAVLSPFVVAFCVIAARTTRGGWRWRWGEED